MPKRKSTIRKMRGYPVSREYHHLLCRQYMAFIGYILLDLHSVMLRLDNFGAKLERTEMEAKAERARHKSV